MADNLNRFSQFWRAFKAQQYAISRGATGAGFIHFGRRLGWKLLRRRAPAAGEYLLTPVLSTRIFELPFAWTCLSSVCRSTQGQFLDVSSPRIFSFFVATQKPDCTVHIINPDEMDVRLTRDVAAALHLDNVTCDQLAVDAISEVSPFRPIAYDCIYAISVIEHIWTDTYDERQAVQWMYAHLRPGGSLILTVPVDRHYWLEYRNENTYNLQSETNQGYFFQRFYDLPAIQTRISDAIGQPPSLIRWYGERQAGFFAHHVEEWRKQGRAAAITHPSEMIDNFCTFDSWEQMPGVGVCGLMFTKPLQKPTTGLTGR